MRGWTRVAGIAAALTTAASAACGTDAAEKVPPGVWAKSVCSAVVPWTAEVKRLQDEARRRITIRSDVEQSKTDLVRLFGGMELATDSALRKVRGAGVPEVPDGSRIATQFVQALAVARDSFGTGMSAVERLPTVDQNAFFGGVVAAGQTMSKDNAAAGQAISTVSSPELDRAFNAIPDCR